LEDRSVDNVKMNLQYVGWEAWAGFLWPRIGTGVGHLRMPLRPVGFYKWWEFLD